MAAAFPTSYSVVLKPLGISAFARSDTDEFHLSLSDMKKLVATLPLT